MKPYNRNTKEYKEFRIKVLNRDRWKCKICGSEVGLNVHHITPISISRKLALVVSNGVTCCRVCHRQLRFRELAFVSLFKKLINNTSLNKTERTLLDMILKHRKVKLIYGSKNNSTKKKKTKKAKVTKRNSVFT